MQVLIRRPVLVRYHHCLLVVFRPVLALMFLLQVLCLELEVLLALSHLQEELSVLEHHQRQRGLRGLDLQLLLLYRLHILFLPHPMLRLHHPLLRRHLLQVLQRLFRSLSQDLHQFEILL
jgi:hypothetical protein